MLRVLRLFGPPRRDSEYTLRATWPFGSHNRPHFLKADCPSAALTAIW